MRFNNIGKKASNRGSKTFCGILLLLTYLGGISVSGSLHRLLHSKSEGHSKFIEEQPCHRAVFHNDKLGGCEHSTHLTEKNKCLLCHVAVAAWHFTTAAHPFQSIDFLSEYLPGESAVLLSISPELNSSRAPPLN